MEWWAARFATLAALTHTNLTKGLPMKRDMDIVRQIVLETADLQPNMLLTGLDNVDPWIFGQPVEWMAEAGLINASIHKFQSGEPPIARVQRLTWDGCDFADAVRSDTLWAKAKEMVIKPTASFTFGLLKDWIVAEVKQGFPTLGR